MLIVKAARRCADCNEPTPAQWLNTAGDCPWCAVVKDGKAHICNRCGVPFAPDGLGCYCDRPTRRALDDAEHIVEQEELEIPADPV